MLDPYYDEPFAHIYTQAPPFHSLLQCQISTALSTFVFTGNLPGHEQNCV